MINLLDEVKQLKLTIEESNSILILTHTSPDGDALGSVVALKEIIQKMGKTPECLLDDTPPNRFPHLTGEFTVSQSVTQCYDLVILVDCADRTRTGVTYPAPKTLACIDHHISNPKDMDINIVNPSASATAEIVYSLLSIWEIQCDAFIASAIYTGILTDTGGFLFTNTTKRTHEHN